MAPKTLTEEARDDVRIVCQDLCCCCIKDKLFFRCMPVFISVTQVLLLVLQGIGTFKNEWVIVPERSSNSNDNSIIPNITGIPSIYKPSVHAENLQEANFGILVIILLIVILTWIRSHFGKKVNPESMKRVVFIYTVPILNVLFGIVSFVGCMLVVDSDYDYGVSFYTCLTVSVIQILNLPIVVLLYINLRNDYLGVNQLEIVPPTPPVGSDNSPDYS